MLNLQRSSDFTYYFYTFQTKVFSPRRFGLFNICDNRLRSSKKEIVFEERTIITVNNFKFQVSR